MCRRFVGPFYLLALTVLVTGLSAIAAPAAKSPAVTPAAPDLFYFQRHLAVELHQQCAGCHSDPESAGRFFLEPLDDVSKPRRATVLKNFRATIAFLDADRPDHSALLRKPLGAVAHGGGELIRSTGSGTYEHLLHFALGATLDNRPPEAITQTRYDTRVRETLELDGTLSGDPDANAISYHWSVAEKPAGSSVAAPSPDGSGGASFGADVAGTYRIELRVHDGRLWSLPASILVVADPAAAVVKPVVNSDARNGGAGESAPARAPKKKAFLDRRIETQRLRLIRRLHFDLKWRTPRMAEVEQWYDRPHVEMVDAFLKDPEVWGNWFEQQLFYFLLLDRFRPKQGRVTTVPERLARGEIPVPIALREIIASTYFGDRNPGNDTFVTVVLEQALGLVVQERRNKRTLDAGKKMYDGYKAKMFKQKGGSQSDFVRIVFGQRAFFRHLLRRTWLELHGTEISEERLEADAERFETDPWAFKPILKEWLIGEAYVNATATVRTKGEIPYVRGLFLDALGRVPTYDELRNVRNAFLSLADPTPIRLVMGRVLLESQQARMPASVLEAEKFVKEQFIRLFARPASARELSTFVRLLKSDPNVTPRTVLWALISSPEYQTY